MCKQTNLLLVRRVSLLYSINDFAELLVLFMIQIGFAGVTVNAILVLVLGSSIKINTSLHTDRQFGNLLLGLFLFFFGNRHFNLGDVQDNWVTSTLKEKGGGESAGCSRKRNRDRGETTDSKMASAVFLGRAATVEAGQAHFQTG
jgi:hypothetical protein